MSHTTITGQCCCGAVRFTVKDSFSRFFFCHCEQCRRMTGSAHASNLFTEPENITWTQGVEQTTRYEHPERSFTQVFCSTCGSGLPYVNSSGKYLIVPAGSLDSEPSKAVDARIFCQEQTSWHKEGLSAKIFDGFPE
ncbi:GFA family protein [Vibrio mangrovi]|uniref:GFA family protein n=1 Tax=Vibrio mangrovi TaxID=474394 RepID=A0A1Y6IS41_9VIBR|nr:GFA family protein [Vibrio mangrovi]MDW6004318.1 GFA family protein [Vibrio mangrovi]SMR98883.1 Glutathione-dependent formaldehyde-activating enzyme [Vibrio mangrovi]